MTNGFTCPAGGCDYGEQDDKSLAAVRAHINASDGDAHDWTELKPDLYQQAEDADDGPDEDTVEGVVEDPDADEGEADGEQTQATETSENDDQEMPTEEEYQQQYEQDDQSSDQSSDQQTTSSSGGPSLPVSTTTLVAFAAVAGLLVALYIRGGDSTADVSEADVDDVEEDADAGATEDVVGLVE